MSTSLKKEFWDRVDDTRIGMLATDTARAIPMSSLAKSWGWSLSHIFAVSTLTR